MKNEDNINDIDGVNVNQHLICNNEGVTFNSYASV